MRKPDPISETLATCSEPAGSFQRARMMTTEGFTRRNTSPTLWARLGTGTMITSSKPRHDVHVRIIFDLHPMLNRLSADRILAARHASRPGVSAIR